MTHKFLSPAQASVFSDFKLNYTTGNLPYPLGILRSAQPEWVHALTTTHTHQYFSPGFLLWLPISVIPSNKPESQKLSMTLALPHLQGQTMPQLCQNCPFPSNFSTFLSQALSILVTPNQSTYILSNPVTHIHNGTEKAKILIHIVFLDPPVLQSLCIHCFLDLNHSCPLDNFNSFTFLRRHRFTGKRSLAFMTRSNPVSPGTLYISFTELLKLVSHIYLCYYIASLTNLSHKGMDLSNFFLPIIFKYLAYCLIHSSCSRDIYGVSKYTN